MINSLSFNVVWTGRTGRVAVRVACGERVLFCDRVNPASDRSVRRYIGRLNYRNPALAVDRAELWQRVLEEATAGFAGAKQVNAGPAGDLLTLTTVAARLKLRPKMLRRIIDNGGFGPALVAVGDAMRMRAAEFERGVLDGCSNRAAWAAESGTSCRDQHP